jgi:hypothetical protein
MCDFGDAVYEVSVITGTRCEFGYAEGSNLCAMMISDTSWCRLDSSDETWPLRLNAWLEWYNPTNTNED